MRRPAYFVLDEHTLCYADPRTPDSLGVLAADVHGYNWINGPVAMPMDPSKLRPATKADFVRFRVDSTGHISEGSFGIERQGTIHRDIHTGQRARELVRAVCPDLAPLAVVERYPTVKPSYYAAPVGGGVFAYQFFDLPGQNVAYYLPDMQSVHILVPPREWGLPKPEYIDIARL